MGRGNIDRNLDGTYWFNAGKHKAIYDRVQKLIPQEGECPDNKPALEALRRAANAYYDIYNNGGCNLAKDIRRIFGISVRKYTSTKNCDPATVKIIEDKMDALIVAAGNENQR